MVEMWSTLDRGMSLHCWPIASLGPSLFSLSSWSLLLTRLALPASFLSDLLSRLLRPLSLPSKYIRLACLVQGYKFDRMLIKGV